MRVLRSALWVLITVGLATAVDAEPPTHLVSAVSNPARPEADRVRDADRKPAEVLAFLGIAPGATVLDLVAGSGYYSEILAYAVGEQGRVYVQNHKWVLERFGDEALVARLSKPALANATRWDRELTRLDLPPGSLDAAVMVLFYHDTYWQGVDRAAMNAAVFEALKPGGVFGVVDHRAEAGSGDRDVKEIHRVDEKWVAREVVAAGFVLEAESDILTHPEDDRRKNVFDPSIRGKTDRFVYRFRKPELKK
jgi:predicted methyltransferase